MTSVTTAKTASLVAGGARWARRVRAHGLSRGAYSVIGKVVNLPVIRRFVDLCAVDVFHARLSDWKPGGHVLRGFDVRQADTRDLAALADYFGSEQRVRERFRRGDRCLAALSRGEMGAAVWFAVGPNDYTEDWDDLRCVFRFPSEVAWSFDGRGTKLGAWGSLMVRFPEQLRELGVEEVFTLVEWNNWRSVDSHKSLGFKNVAAIGCLRIAPLVWRAFSTNGRRWRAPPGSIGRLELHTSLTACLHG